MSKLYVAYGSNLNMMQMGWRCPTASVVGTGKIIDYKLTFRRVATIEPCVKCEVPVAVWKIEDSDEKITSNKIYLIYDDTAANAGTMWDGLKFSATATDNAIGYFSIEIAGAKPSIKSTSGFFCISKN